MVTAFPLYVPCAVLSHAGLHVQGDQLHLRRPAVAGNQTNKDPGIVSSLLGPPTTIFKDVKSGDTEHYRNTWKDMEVRSGFPRVVSELGLARR